MVVDAITLVYLAMHTWSPAEIGPQAHTIMEYAMHIIIAKKIRHGEMKPNSGSFTFPPPT